MPGHSSLICDRCRDSLYNHSSQHSGSCRGTTNHPIVDGLTFMYDDFSGWYPSKEENKTMAGKFALGDRVTPAKTTLSNGDRISLGIVGTVLAIRNKVGVQLATVRWDTYAHNCEYNEGIYGTTIYNDLNFANEPAINLAKVGSKVIDLRNNGLLPRRGVVARLMGYGPFGILRVKWDDSNTQEDVSHLNDVGGIGLHSDIDVLGDPITLNSGEIVGGSDFLSSNDTIQAASTLIYVSKKEGEKRQCVECRAKEDATHKLDCSAGKFIAELKLIHTPPAPTPVIVQPTDIVKTETTAVELGVISSAG